MVLSSADMTSHVPVILRVRGGSEAATITRLPPSMDYRCCVVANLDRTIFDLVTLTSSKCVSISPGESTISSSEEGLSTVTTALGGLVGVLIFVIIVVAVSCVYIMLSKRKYRQVTHPRYVR